MALGNQVFKVIGMWRDNSESSQDNKYAYENFNMRIEARDGNTQLSMENERGNEKIEIIGEKIDNSYTDAQASISDGLLQIKGTPIGYCQIGDDILLFTTETERMSDEELQEYNEDTTYTTNKKNLFVLSSAKISSISVGTNSTTIKLFLSLSEISDWVNFLDDLEIKMIVSQLTHTNEVGDNYSFDNFSAIGVKTAEPVINGVLYDFTIDQKLEGDYIFIHSLEIRYDNNIAAIIDLRKLFSFNDYKNEMLGSIISFPTYTVSQNDFTTGFTQVGGYNTQPYDLCTINGVSSKTGNVISFTPNDGYLGKINQVFTQDITGSTLVGLKSGGTVAAINNTSVTVPNNSLHSDIAILKTGEETIDPSTISVTGISCDPTTRYVAQQGTFNVTVTPTPANAQCTATCDYASDYIQLVGRSGNTFTFKLLSIGQGESQIITFSCEENRSVSATCEVFLGTTRLVNTPSFYTFTADGSDEFSIKIFSSQYTASDFIVKLDGADLEQDGGLSTPDFIYTVAGMTDVGLPTYNIELDLYATPIPASAGGSRSSVLTIRYPDYSFFASFILDQTEENHGGGGSGGGSGEDPYETGD